jgi:hypothetical protein
MHLWLALVHLIRTIRPCRPTRSEETKRYLPPFRIVSVQWHLLWIKAQIVIQRLCEVLIDHITIWAHSYHEEL